MVVTVTSLLLVITTITTTSFVCASADVNKDASQLWDCPTLVEDGDDLLREPTACVHLNLQGRKGTLVHVPYADLTLEAAVRVFLHNYFPQVDTSSEVASPSCTSSSFLHAHFSSPRAPLTPTFIELVAAGVFRSRWAPLTRIKGLELSAYNCLRQQQQHNSTSLALIDDLVLVERGVFTGDLFLGRTPGGEIIEGLSDGEDDDFTDGDDYHNNEGPVASSSSPPQQGGNTGGKSTLSWGDGDGMLIYSQDSFVDPFKPSNIPFPSTASPPSPSSSTSTITQGCIMNTTKNCRNEVSCGATSSTSPGKEANDDIDNNMATLLRGLPHTFDTSTSRYVSGRRFDEIHFSTHITIPSSLPLSSSDDDGGKNRMKMRRIRVTAIVSLDVVNEAPVAIDSTVRVGVVPTSNMAALSISIPVDFQHFKAYDADFQKLRNDFELHHVNLIDQLAHVPVTVVGGASSVVCTATPTTTSSSTSGATAAAAAEFGDNGAIQGSTSVVCQLPPPTTTASSTTSSSSTAPLNMNVSWHVVRRPCSEGTLEVSTTTPNASSSPSSSEHLDATPVNAATQGSPASMPRCLGTNGGGSVHSESLVVTVTSTSTTTSDALQKLLEAGGVAVSFPFLVWDSEGVASNHLAHTTLLITSVDPRSTKIGNSPQYLTPLPPVTSQVLMQAFSQSASSVIRPVRLGGVTGSSYHIPSLTTTTVSQGLPNGGVDEQMLKVVSVEGAPSCDSGVDGGMFQLRSTGRPLRMGDVLLGSRGGLDGLVQYVPCRDIPAVSTDTPTTATTTATTGGSSESLTTTVRALSHYAHVHTTTTTCSVCHSSVSFRTASGESFTVQSPSSSSTTSTTPVSKIQKVVQDVSIVLPTTLPPQGDGNGDSCASVDIPIRIPSHTTTTSTPTIHLLSGLSNTSWLRSPPSSFSPSGVHQHLDIFIGTPLPLPTATNGCAGGAAAAPTKIVVRITPHLGGNGSCQNVWRYANMLSNTNAVETLTLLVGGTLVLQVNIRLERKMEGSSAPTVRILPSSTSSSSSDVSMTVLRIDHGPKDRSPLTIGAQEQVSLAVRRPSTTSSSHVAVDATPNSHFGVVNGGGSGGFGVASATFGADAFGQVLLPVSHVVTVTPSSSSAAPTATVKITGIVTDTATISSTAPLAAVMEFAASVRLLMSASQDRSSTLASIHSTSAMCRWLSQQHQTTASLRSSIECVSGGADQSTTTTLSIPLRHTSAFHCDTITSTSTPVQCAFRITVMAGTVLELFQQVAGGGGEPSSSIGVEYLYASKVGVLDVQFEATLATLADGMMTRFVVTRSPPSLIRDQAVSSSSKLSPLSSKRLYSTSSADSPQDTPLSATSTATETSADVVVVFMSTATDGATQDNALEDGTNTTTMNNSTTDPNATVTNTTLPPPTGNQDESGEYDPDHPDGYHIAKACLTVAGVFLLLLLVKYQQMILCVQYFIRTFKQSNALRQATKEATRRVHKRKRAKPSTKKRLIVQDTSEDGARRRSSSFLSFFGVQHSAFSDDDEYEVESDEETIPSLPEPHSEFMGGGDRLDREGLLEGGAGGGVLGGGVAIEMESGIAKKAVGTVDAHQIIGAPPRRSNNTNTAATGRHRATVASVPPPTSNNNNNSDRPQTTATTGFDAMFTPREDGGREEDLGDSFGQYRRASIFVGGNQQQHQPSGSAAPQTTTNKPPIKTAAPPSSVWSEGSSGQRSPVQTVPPPQRKKKSDNTSDIIGDSQN